MFRCHHHYHHHHPHSQSANEWWVRWAFQSFPQHAVQRCLHICAHIYFDIFRHTCTYTSTYLQIYKFKFLHFLTFTYICVCTYLTEKIYKIIAHWSIFCIPELLHFHSYMQCILCIFIQFALKYLVSSEFTGYLMCHSSCTCQIFAN